MHKPFKCIVPGAENAVLFVHGIVSTPRMFDDFVALVPQTWSVHNLLLPGHGGTVQDFGRLSMISGAGVQPQTCVRMHSNS